MTASSLPPKEFTPSEQMTFDAGGGLGS